MPENEYSLPRIIPDQTRAPGGPREGPLSPRSLLRTEAGGLYGTVLAAASGLTDYPLA